MAPETQWHDGHPVNTQAPDQVIDYLERIVGLLTELRDCALYERQARQIREAREIAR